MMPTGLSERWLQRFAALTAVWMIGYTMDINYADGESWWIPVAFLGIMMVVEFLAFRHGIATGIDIYMRMTPEQRKTVEKMLKDE